jgi:hypothetical protein
MLFGLEGCTELVFLVLQLEFAGLLFSDVFLAFSITLVILEFEVTNYPLLSIQDCPRIQFLMRNVQCSRGSGNPSLTKLLFLPCPEWDCSLVPTRS